MKDHGAFRVLTDAYVSSDAGTGVVHQAPYFGEVMIIINTWMFSNNFNILLITTHLFIYIICLLIFLDRTIIASA